MKTEKSNRQVLNPTVQRNICHKRLSERGTPTFLPSLVAIDNSLRAGNCVGRLSLGNCFGWFQSGGVYFHGRCQYDSRYCHAYPMEPTFACRWYIVLLCFSAAFADCVVF